MNRTPKLRPSPSFDLDESDGALPLYNQIDVAVTAPEPTLDYSPTSMPKPPLSYSFSEFAKRLPGR